MGNLLQSLSKTVHLSLGIAILLLVGLHLFGDGFALDRYFFSSMLLYPSFVPILISIPLLRS